MKKLLCILLAALLLTAIGAHAEEGVQAPAQIVEITMDNWQDYFEIQVICPPMRKANGDPATRYMYALKLKDGYAEGYRAHASYALPENFQELYQASDRTMLYMQAIDHEGGFDFGDACYLSATLKVTCDASAGDVLFAPIFTNSGDSETEIRAEITEGNYVDYFFYIGLEGPQAETYGHVMSVLDETDTTMNSEGVDGFMSAVAVEMIDISGTLPIWE